MALIVRMIICMNSLWCLEAYKMNVEGLMEISNQTIFVAFIFLLVAIVPVGLSVTSRNEWAKRIGLGEPIRRYYYNWFILFLGGSPLVMRQ